MAGAVMALLFAGNRVLIRAAPPKGADAPTQESTQPPAQISTLPTAEPGTEAPTDPPVDPRTEALAEAAEAMQAGSIFVYDTGSGEMLFTSHGAEQTVYPASITKLFSAWVALKYLDPETVITAGDELSLVQPGSSTAYIRKGCRLTVEMLVEAMLLPSGNDGAYVLAAAAGRVMAGEETLTAAGAVATFVEGMNREAATLGMEHSHFMNPDGYHQEEHVSSPADMAKIGVLALENPVILRYAAKQQDSVIFRSGEWITWYNTNALLNPESPYYLPSCVGLKTGYTSEAGYCLLAAFRQENSTILMGIFDAETRESRYRDAKTLLEVCDSAAGGLGEEAGIQMP